VFEFIIVFIGNFSPKPKYVGEPRLEMCSKNLVFFGF